MRYFVIRCHLNHSLNEIKWKKDEDHISDEKSYGELKD